MFLDSENYLPTLKKVIVEAASIDMAVAFWGNGAEKLLLGSDKPIRIVCNLTSGGTNPSVIEAIQKRGVEVRHLSDLHAKVILGGRTAILGSANCSANGLSLEGEETNGWQEAGYVITSEPDIAQMQDWFLERWHSAEGVTPQLLKRALDTWKTRRKTRVTVGNNAQTLLSLPPSSVVGRNIVVAVYRDNKLSKEALKALEEKKLLAKNDKGLTRSWTLYEDWSAKDLRKGMVVIDVYIGKKGGVTVEGPYKIFAVTKSKRKQKELKGETMTLHYANRATDLIGLPPKAALTGIKERVGIKAFDLLPIGTDAKIIPFEEFVTLV